MQNAPLPDNLKSRVVRLHFEKGSFVPEGQTELIDYETLYLTVSIKGENLKIKLPIEKAEKSLLKLSDVVEQPQFGEQE